MALQVACEAFIGIDDITCDCGDVSEATRLEYIESASDIIAILTGGKVAGRCSDIVRPCNVRSCGCSRASLCSCGLIDLITLADPNPTVTEILIDGVTFVDYAIVDGNQLVRADGSVWPGYQDNTKLSTETGTFEISYDFGLEVPQLAKDACAEIVCSFVKSGPQDTRKTHPNTRSMSISGVSISLEQQVMEIKRRSFMMPYLIRTMTVYAPNGPSPALVYSPELEDGWTLHRVSVYGS